MWTWPASEAPWRMIPTSMPEEAVLTWLTVGAAGVMWWWADRWHWWGSGHPWQQGCQKEIGPKCWQTKGSHVSPVSKRRPNQLFVYNLRIQNFQHFKKHIHIGYKVTRGKLRFRDFLNDQWGLEVPTMSRILMADSQKLSFSISRKVSFSFFIRQFPLYASDLPS